MRIAVLGVGSIGGLILGALSTTDHDLVAVSRAETALRLSAEGLVLHRHDGPIEMIPPGRFEVVDTSIDEEASQVSKSIDIAIICGKSGDTEPYSVGLLGKVLTQSGMVLSLQNGLGNVEKLNEIIGKERVLGGSTTHGAWKKTILGGYIGLVLEV